LVGELVGGVARGAQAMARLGGEAGKIVLSGIKTGVSDAVALPGQAARHSFGATGRISGRVSGRISGRGGVSNTSWLRRALRRLGLRRWVKEPRAGVVDVQDEAMDEAHEDGTEAGRLVAAARPPEPAAEERQVDIFTA
jgi:hypothetical protein